MRLFSSRLLLKGNPKQWDFPKQNINLSTMTCTDLFHDGTQFVALGYKYNEDINRNIIGTSTSSDGNTWSEPYFDKDVNASVGNAYNCIAYNGTYYCSITKTRTNGNRIATGTSLNSLEASLIFDFRKDVVSLCADSSNKFVSISTYGYITKSDNTGSSWGESTIEQGLQNHTWNKIRYNKVRNTISQNEFVAAGDGVIAIKNSSATTWQTNNSDNINWQAMDCVDIYLTVGAKLEITVDYYFFSSNGYIGKKSKHITMPDNTVTVMPLVIQNLPYLHLNLGNDKWVGAANNGIVQVILSKNGYISTKEI